MRLIALTLLMLSVVWPGTAQSDEIREPVRLLKQRLPVVLMPDKSLNGYSLRSKGNSTEIVVISSADEGHTWTEPRVVMEVPQTPDKIEALLPSVDGGNSMSIFLFSRRAIWLSRSRDGGTNWSPFKKIYDGKLAPNSNEISDSRQRLPASGINNPVGSISFAHLKSKRLLLPINYWADRHFWKGRRRGKGPDNWNDMGNYNVSALYSDDSGATWTKVPDELKIATPSITKDGAESPVVLELKDQRVWMLMASQRGRLFESWSKDGINWSPPAPTSFLSSESAASLTRLRNGDILLLWNNCLRHPYAHGGRHVLHAAISKDDGKTWHGFREVYRDPMVDYPFPQEGEFGTGFPQAIETAKGNILFSAGESSSEGTLIFDPEWLMETQQADDFMDGLKSWSVFATKGVELAKNADMGGYNAEGAQVLRVYKADPEWPATAVWNFPAAKKGSLRIKLMRSRTFGGTAVLLTDHFSTPFDVEDRLNAVFDLEISADGRLGSSDHRLEGDRWYDILLEWDFDKKECEVSVDGKSYATLPQLRISNGASYLRLKSNSSQPDSGIYVESVAMSGSKVD